jgi:hypothetical protein
MVGTLQALVALGSTLQVGVTLWLVRGSEVVSSVFSAHQASVANASLLTLTGQISGSFGSAGHKLHEPSVQASRG